MGKNSAATKIWQETGGNLSSFGTKVKYGAFASGSGPFVAGPFDARPFDNRPFEGRPFETRPFDAGRFVGVPLWR